MVPLCVTAITGSPPARTSSSSLGAENVGARPVGNAVKPGMVAKVSAWPEPPGAGVDWLQPASVVAARSAARRRMRIGAPRRLPGLRLASRGVYVGGPESNAVADGLA